MIEPRTETRMIKGKKAFVSFPPSLGALRGHSGVCGPCCYCVLVLVSLQYALYKKMTQAAILIQSKFRSYYEQKKFQQSRRAAVLIQKYYRSYKKCGKRRQARRTAVIVQQKLRWVELSAG